MTATLSLHSDQLPLRADATGIIRVGASRVSLDIVVEAYEKGMPAEAIVEEYDSLDLADVHGAIAYYLRHRDEVQDYLRRRQADADQLRAVIEAEQKPFPTKAELLARQKSLHAEAGQ